MESLFMIKFGKLEHLQNIVDGFIRFTPLGVYRDMEREKGERGRGDSSDGKLHANLVGRVQFINHDPTKPSFSFTAPSFEAEASDAETTPIFCLSSYFEEDSIMDEEGKISVSLQSSKLMAAKKAFNPSHALIIFEPRKFISDVESIPYRVIKGGFVHYFDKNQNDLSTFKFLHNNRDGNLSLVSENVYRMGFLKQRDLCEQQEFRFIVTDKNFNEAQSIQFSMTSKCKIVTIEELEQPIPFEIN